MNMENPGRVLTPVRPNLGIRDRRDLFKATRIGAADLNEPKLPLSRKLTLVFGLAGIAACGGNTTEPSTTTTPPTTIESTTTIPTTTLPLTTTTVPESTTTTTIPTEPSGLVIGSDGKAVPLGKIGEERPPQRVETIVSVRVIDAYEQVVEDFQGRPENVLFLRVVSGKKNDDPNILSLMIGRADDILTVDISIDGRGLNVSTTAMTVSELKDRLLNQADRDQQIYIQFITEYESEEVKNACSDPNIFNQNIRKCEWGLEGLEHFDTNEKVLRILNGENEVLQPDEFVGLVTRIYLFPPHN